MGKRQIATHFEGNQTTTLFSNIYNLKNGDVYIYNFHNFEDVVRLNLKEKLAKGRKEYALPGLFPGIPYAQHRFVPQSVSTIMIQSINKKGLEKTFEELIEVKQLCLATFDIDYVESIVNSLGYDLLEDDRIEDAIEVFKFNVSEYPQSANVFDSMGEAYTINGDKELAIQSYKNPLN
jgi:tetratricopeptide (TPR) repeat protein